MPSTYLRLVRALWDKIIKDDVSTQSAALSFYTALSLAPLTILAVLALTLLTPEASKIVLDQSTQLFGTELSQIISVILKSAQSSLKARRNVEIVTLGTILFSATAAFVQLRTSLNRIWEVKPSAAAWWRARLLSAVLVLGVGVMLLASFIASTILLTLEYLPVVQISGVVAFLPLVTVGVSFSILFKVVPTSKVLWRSALLGGFVTSAFFGIGKKLISYYVTHAAPSSAYGAAGSFVILLIWLYYSSFIFLTGAEFTYLLDKHFARRSS